VGIGDGCQVGLLLTVGDGVKKSVGCRDVEGIAVGVAVGDMLGGEVVGVLVGEDVGSRVGIGEGSSRQER
jgi:hypothetical protein